MDTTETFRYIPVNARSRDLINVATGRFISYYRVSTARQDQSRLGLEARKAGVRASLDGGDWRLVAAFPEIESGKTNDRPKLARALADCRLRTAPLVIAKLARLSRKAAFLLN